MLCSWRQSLSNLWGLSSLLSKNYHWSSTVVAIWSSLESPWNWLVCLDLMYTYYVSEISVQLKCKVFHSPVNLLAHSHAYLRLLPLTPTPIRTYPCLLPLTPAHSRSLPLTPAHSRTCWYTTIYGRMTKAECKKTQIDNRLRLARSNWWQRLLKSKRTFLLL